MTETPSRSLDPGERLDWLRLIRSENVGPVTFHHLLRRFGTAARALQALPDLARQGGRGRPVTICPRAAAEQEMVALAAAGARLVAHGEADYPPLLARIEDAPPLLAVKGHAGLLSKRAVAVVGARNASANGRRLARSLSAELGRRGLLVVSGLARGIDSAAHEGALETGTVAVLGGGIDVVYPPENAALHQAIAEHGALVTEVAVGTEPQARHFPRRNRLISGIARGVVVVEASPRSGSLITARFALEQGREVFAVPGSPLDPRARGGNDLIRQGATLTEGADDVLRVLDDMLRGPLGEPAAPSPGAPAPAPIDETTLDGARAAVLESLGPEAVTVDEIIRSCQLAPPVVSMALLELELAGRLERHPGGRVALAAET